MNYSFIFVVIKKPAIHHVENCLLFCATLLGSKWYKSLFSNKV